MHKKLTQTTYLYIAPTIYNKLPFEINYTNPFKKKYIYIYYIHIGIYTFWLLLKQIMVYKKCTIESYCIIYCNTK